MKSFKKEESLGSIFTDLFAIGMPNQQGFKEAIKKINQLKQIKEEEQEKEKKKKKMRIIKYVIVSVIVIGAGILVLIILKKKI